MSILLRRIVRRIQRTPGIMHRHYLWFTTVKHLYKKDGIEFGGPTELFYDKQHRMMLYPYISSLDGCNLFEDNFFQNNLSDVFTYYKKKSGKRYNVDTALLEDLKKIPKKYDFIVASHHIEHIANPLKALMQWKEILKPEGYILAIMPHKDDTFDRKRPLTKMSHLVQDYTSNMGEDDMTHRDEQVALHDWTMGGMKNFEELSRNNKATRVIHHHCFDTALVREMFEFCGYKTLQNYYIGNGNIVYLGKKEG